MVPLVRKTVYLVGLAAAVPGFSQQAPGTAPGTAPSTVLAPPLVSPFRIITPAVQPTLTPGVIHLMQLEGEFQQAVVAGGGKAFASWFAEDAVTLSEGKPAVLGQAAIAAQANWDPKDYQLTWIAQGAQVGPSNDMGFTWGRYEGRSIPPDGRPIVTTGRYMTVWKKLPDGSWKVALEASAAEPAETGACCVVPRP